MCDLGAFPHPVLIQALLGPEIANCLNHTMPIHIAWGYIIVSQHIS